jgi:hypothetical protein
MSRGQRVAVAVAMIPVLVAVVLALLPVRDGCDIPIREWRLGEPSQHSQPRGGETPLYRDFTLCVNPSQHRVYESGIVLAITVILATTAIVILRPAAASRR